MTPPTIKALGVIQEWFGTSWKASGYVEGIGWLAAWGPSLITALAALPARKGVLMISITSCRRRLRLIAAALLLYFAAAHPATARVAMYQPKPVAELQLMTASELTLEAMQACDGAVGSRLMADHRAAIQLGKQSAYLTESQEHRDYLATVLRVLRAHLGREPLWMGEFRQAALSRDPQACSRAHEHSLVERQPAPR